MWNLLASVSSPYVWQPIEFSDRRIGGPSPFSFRQLELAQLGGATQWVFAAATLPHESSQSVASSIQHHFPKVLPARMREFKDTKSRRGFRFSPKRGFHFSFQNLLWGVPFFDSFALLFIFSLCVPHVFRTFGIPRLITARTGRDCANAATAPSERRRATRIRHVWQRR